MSLKITKIFQIEKETQKPGIKVRKQSRYFQIYWSSTEKHEVTTPCHKTMEVWLQVEEWDKRDTQEKRISDVIYTHEKILKTIIPPGKGKKSRFYAKNHR